MINLSKAFSLINIQSTKKEIISTIIQSAMDAVDPYQCVVNSMQITGQGLILHGRDLSINSKKVSLISIGKASLPMTQAAVDLLGDRINRILCVCKHLPEIDPGWRNAEIFQGDHPIPGVNSVLAGRAIRKFLSNTIDDEILLCLISGGGSSLIVDPVDGIELLDIQRMTGLLLNCGAAIQEINCLRKHLDRLKGGRFAASVPNAKIYGLILSDVIGNPLESIASGMTEPDPSTFSDAWKILEKYQLLERVSPSIISYLENGMAGKFPDTPKPGQSPWNALNVLIGSNETAALSALKTGEKSGVNCCIMTNRLAGEARQAGEMIAHWISGNGNTSIPRLWIAGGETTVTVKGKGKGGRNLEVALGAVRALAQKTNCVLITLATDGEDGTSGCAGAIVTEETLGDALRLGMKPEEYLNNNDSYTFFKKLDQLIITGPTGTNVNDLVFLFEFPDPLS